MGYGSREPWRCQAGGGFFTGCFLGEGFWEEKTGETGNGGLQSGLTFFVGIGKIATVFWVSEKYKNGGVAHAVG